MKRWIILIALALAATAGAVHIPKWITVTDTTGIRKTYQDQYIYNGRHYVGMGGYLLELSTPVGGTLSASNITANETLGAELLAGTSAMSAWSGSGTWSFASAKWSHATGTVDVLTAGVWVPTSTVHYKLVYTLAQTVAGTGVTASCGGFTCPLSSAAGTYTYYFTASAATALKFTPGSGGTWVGDLTACSITVNSNGTYTGNGATFNDQVRVVMGSATYPSFTFKNDQTSGVYYDIANAGVAVGISGVRILSIQGLATTLIPATSYFGLRNSYTRIYSDASNRLDQRNGTAAQLFEVYNTSTTALTNFEAFGIDATATATNLRQDRGTVGGTLRPVKFLMDGIEYGTLTTAGLWGFGMTTPTARQHVAEWGTNNIAAFGGPDAELITATNNRTFEGAGNWTITGWSVTGGVLIHTTGNTTAASLAVANLTTGSIVTGGKYIITFDLVNATTQTISWTLGAAVAGPAFNLAGTTYQVSVVALANDAIPTVTPTSTFVGSIDNVSIKRVTDKVTIANTGNVGIGVTAPADVLTIGSSKIPANISLGESISMYLGQGGSVWNGVLGHNIKMASDNTVKVAASHASFGYRGLVFSYSDDNTTGIAFYATRANVTAGGAIGDPRMLISNAGNVGIGTPTPYHLGSFVGKLAAINITNSNVNITRTDSTTASDSASVKWGIIAGVPGGVVKSNTGLTAFSVVGMDATVGGNLNVQATANNHDIYVGTTPYSYMDAGDASWTILSDSSLKDNIIPVSVDNILDRVGNLQPIKYNFKKSAYLRDVPTKEFMARLDSVGIVSRMSRAQKQSQGTFTTSTKLDTVGKDSTTGKPITKEVEVEKFYITKAKLNTIKSTFIAQDSLAWLRDQQKRADDQSKKLHYGFTAQNFNGALFDNTSKKEINYNEAETIQWQALIELTALVKTQQSTIDDLVKRVEVLEKR